MKFVYTKQFQRDIKKAQSTLLIPKIERLIEIVRRNPFQNPPPYEKLSGYENWFQDVSMNNIVWCIFSAPKRRFLSAVGDIMSRERCFFKYSFGENRKNLKYIR